MCPGSPGAGPRTSVFVVSTVSSSGHSETTLMGTVLYGIFKTSMRAGVTTLNEQHTSCVTPS